MSQVVESGSVAAAKSGAPSSLAVRVAIQLMVATGGIAALSWEVVWQLEATLSLGAGAQATAITLAATMAGMTAGSLVTGRWLRDNPQINPVLFYGLLELTIGCAGLLTGLGFGALERLDAVVYGVSPALATIVHLFGIALLLGVPTFSMGATIPTFQRIAQRHGTPVSVLYALNTAGASLGTILLAFVLLPRFGVWQSCMIAAGLNFSVLAAALAISRTHGRAIPASIPADESIPVRRSGDPSLAIASLTVFVTGFATFSLEVAWFRSLRAAFFSTTDSFAIMLASVLIPLAIGARLVPLLRRTRISLGVVLTLAGISILLATPVIERMDLLVPKHVLFWKQTALRLSLSLSVLGPTMFLLGIALPWCLEAFPEPRANGRLYAINTAGAVLGSLLAAWLLLPSFGFAACAWIVGCTVIAIGALQLQGRTRGVAVFVGILCLALAINFKSGLGRERVQGFRPGVTGMWDSNYRIKAYKEGPDATVSIIQTAGGVHHLLIDGFFASSEHKMAQYMHWMGRLPMLLNEDPASALVICFGTGRTADAVRSEGPEALDVVDISASVIEFGPQFPANHQVLDDPRVHPHIMDGRAWLRRSGRRYDVVTLEPMPPTFAGVNSLYSKEFYEIAASNLNPGGVVTQWLPIHLLTPYDAASIAATFVEVFPDSILWLDPVGMTGILLGRVESDAMQIQPLGSTWPGLDRLKIERELEDEEIRLSLALDREGLAEFASTGDIITDDNQLLAYGDGDGRHNAETEKRRWMQINVRRMKLARGSLPYIRKAPAGY